MIIALEIKDIKPRQDVSAVIQMIQDYLSKCDAGDRPDLRIEYPR